MIAALFVQPSGVYSRVAGVDIWGPKRDARLYAGPFPVVGHPPCQRWGRYFQGGPSHPGLHTLGDDGGCFASALASVRRYGGVLEHPKDSKAWDAHGLRRPPSTGGWIQADSLGLTCCVDQGHYGHRARKPTWLYTVGVGEVPLEWGRSGAQHSVEKMGRHERARTPVPFRDLLIEMARAVRT